MMRDIRAAIGPDKLLTLASSASPGYYNFKDILPYIDFVNIMTYDMENPPKHHSALYRSPMAGWTCGDESVKGHIEAGVPANMLTLGIPFYGRASNAIKPGNDSFVPYYEIVQLIAQGKFNEKWDDVAKVPYLVDGSGNIVCTYDNPRSIAIKCQYALDRGLLGAMYWDYSQDDAQSSLRNAVYKGVMRGK
jgi:chitinase